MGRPMVSFELTGAGVGRRRGGTCDPMTTWRSPRRSTRCCGTRNDAGGWASRATAGSRRNSPGTCRAGRWSGSHEQLLGRQVPQTADEPAVPLETCSGSVTSVDRVPLGGDVKQAVQNLEVRRGLGSGGSPPRLHCGGALVATMSSLISAGTERSKIELGEKSMLGKAAPARSWFSRCSRRPVRTA